MTNKTPINEPRYTVGTNMKCVRVVTKVTLLYVHEVDASGYDCVFQSRGIQIKGNTNEMYMTREEAKRACERV
jgi:hypothetical protein